nr:aminomethyl transferase family protein [Paracoccaceae bacterium]
KVGRLSVCGELGYEINCGALEHISLRETLLEAGEEFNIREFGFYAMNSLRLEKGFGIWSAEFKQDYTPFETGMHRWIDWEKDKFIGKLSPKDLKVSCTPSRQLVMLEVDALDADASGYEPVWDDGKKVGYITSGGYGHFVKKSLALAMVDKKYLKPGTILQTHIVGEERNATVIENSVYDPLGSKIRS